MDIITSNQNASIKNIKSLKARRTRDEKGMFFVEGARIVEEAISESDEIQGIILSEGFYSNSDNQSILDRINSLKITVNIVTEKVFKELSETDTPQGILAVMKMNRCEPDKIITGEGFYVLLDSIRDPGNMGTIIRTADAAGFSGVIVSKGCVDVYNSKVLRSTMGSVFHIPIIQFDNTIEAIEFLKSRNIKIIAAHLDGEKSIFESILSRGTAFLIGSEADGISKEASERADELIRIPMFGRAESLNASVAAGIMIYEAVRQKSNHT